MFPPRGIPQDVDDETYLKVAHSFYVVRMVRYALLLVALGAVLALALAEDAPRAVAVALGASILAMAVVAVRTHRTYVTGRITGRRSASRASGSPTAG
jgi:hypothetical protein